MAKAMVPCLAHACMCLPTPINEEGSTDGYEVVFVGELIAIERTNKFFPDTQDIFPVEINSYIVHESFIGSVSLGDTVHIHQFGIGCTNPRREDQLRTKFLIGGFRDEQKVPDWPSMQEYLQAQLCTLSYSELSDPEYSSAVQVVRNRMNTAFEVKVASILVAPLMTVIVIGSIGFVLFIERVSIFQ
ncbi:hypothetical protein [Neolewinella xylanilytica]|nr:hypothetical protein [Neolewinella xylanilytica]